MKHGLGDRIITAPEVEKGIDECIFSERDRKILKRRLIDGIHFEPLAEEFDLSVRYTKTIVYKGEDRLFKHLERSRRDGGSKKL